MLDDKIPENGVDITSQFSITGYTWYSDSEGHPSVLEVETKWFSKCIAPEEFLSREDIDRDTIKDLYYHFSICVKDDAPDDTDTWYQVHDAQVYTQGFLSSGRGSYQLAWMGGCLFSKTGYANSNHYVWVDKDYNGYTHEISVPREQFRVNGVNTTVGFFDELKQALYRQFSRVELHGPFIEMVDIEEKEPALKKACELTLTTT